MQSDVQFFEKFGFLHLKEFVSMATMSQLTAEFEAEMVSGFGDTERSSGVDSGRDGLFLPLMTMRTPTSLRLLDACSELSAELLGGPVLPSFAEGTVFFGMTGWHTDSGHELKSARCLLYFEPLTADTGALRFAPGSHHQDYSKAFHAYFRSLGIEDDEAEERAIQDTPSHACETQPGDLLVLDEHIWHAAGGGHRRRQWAATYVRTPAEDEQLAKLSRFYESEFLPASSRGYDGERHPYYDAEWLSLHAECAQLLDRAGALEAAARGARG